MRLGCSPWASPHPTQSHSPGPHRLPCPCCDPTPKGNLKEPRPGQHSCLSGALFWPLPCCARCPRLGPSPLDTTFQSPWAAPPFQEVEIALHPCAPQPTRRPHDGTPEPRPGLTAPAARAGRVWGEAGPCLQLGAPLRLARNPGPLHDGRCPAVKEHKLPRASSVSATRRVQTSLPTTLGRGLGEQHSRLSWATPEPRAMPSLFFIQAEKRFYRTSAVCRYFDNPMMRREGL